jgi:tRNA A37 threonylcarbamoyladenosine synthetase subunit TsaC/SUA5/YrdC
MANTNRTDVTIKGLKEAIRYFQKKYDVCVDGKYPAEEGQTHIIDALYNRKEKESYKL